jgi:hypothetical protein
VIHRLELYFQGFGKAGQATVGLSTEPASERRLAQSFKCTVRGENKILLRGGRLRRPGCLFEPRGLGLELSRPQRPGRTGTPTAGWVRVSTSTPTTRCASAVARLKALSGDNTGSVSFGNDPSAGSPTETLLRLLLPLNDQV